MLSMSRLTGRSRSLRRTAGAFVPLAMESLGGWQKVAIAKVRRLGGALVRHTGQEESEAVRHLFERLSVLLVKGNAALLLNRVPSFAETVTDGIE